jgi:hypothetical protein
MAEMLNFSDGKYTCYANVRLDSGDACYISVAQSGVVVKKSRFGAFGPVLYKETIVYKAAMTAKALHYLYADNRTPPGIDNPVLKAFTNAVLHCSSAADVSGVLNQAIEVAERTSATPIGELLVPPAQEEQTRRNGPQPPKRRQWEGLSGKPFTLALLTKAELEAQEAKKWMKDTVGGVREATPPDTLEEDVAHAMATLAVCLTMKAADRNRLKLPLPGQAPTKQTPVIAAFGLVLLGALADGVGREGITVDHDASAAVFFTGLYLLHSVEERASLAMRGIAVLKELVSVELLNVRKWREEMATLATCCVLQASSSNPKLKELDVDWLASEMLATALRAIK